MDHKLLRSLKTVDTAGQVLLWLLLPLLYDGFRFWSIFLTMMYWQVASLLFHLSYRIPWKKDRIRLALLIALAVAVFLGGLMVVSLIFLVYGGILVFLAFLAASLLYTVICLVEWVYMIRYYRHADGDEPVYLSPMGEFFSGLISLFKRKILRLSRDRWNYQYARGQWEGLKREDDRFEAVIRMMGALHDRPHILEIGCGDAVLLRKMPETSYSSFTGVDISDVAIASAKGLEGERVQFIAADMKTFRPDRGYDLIIFNESLYYTDRTVALLQHYEPWLEGGGSFIITAVDNKYTQGFWAPLEGAYKVRLSEEVSDGKHLWRVKQLLPGTLV